MSTVSVCVIAKNEISNIERMTKSIEGLFDEYIFVDTGSTDGTIEKAKELGWSVHHFEWINDFSAARNYSFSLATKDFIFWLDLDDVLCGNFLDWKRLVMPLYDYHLANYNYAFKDGLPVCTFVRERCVRRSKQMKWRYRIHEGITPETANSAVSANFASSWWVDHLRTAEDLAKDKTRNLTVFNELKEYGIMDARMRYYYGKELFEHGNIFEAIPELEGALLDKKLEVHDRILAIQYLCFAHMAASEKYKDGEMERRNFHYSQAINHASNGILLSPIRAEFYNLIGDCYIKSGKLLESVPYFNAALNCPRPNSNNPSPIFSHGEAYDYHPLTQLVRVWSNLQDFEKAREYANKAFNVKDTLETRTMLKELDNIQFSLEGYKLGKECKDIVFTTPPFHAYPFDPSIAKEKSMGGSETALIEMAKWIRKKYNGSVKVFMMRDDYKEFDGVEYIPNKEVPLYMSKFKPYLHIAWRHNLKITDAPTFLWSHDLVTPGVEAIDRYNKVMCLTPWHADYMHVTQGVPKEKIYITRNGVIEDRFLNEVDISKKDPMLFVFGSSPDRGLDNAILVLDEVRKKHPVKLRIHYGWDHWGDCAQRPDLLNIRDRLRKMVTERDWIEYVGPTQQDKLMESYREASYNVQPSAWLETSAISAMELVLCGVYPIFRKVGGVCDTLKPYVEEGMAELVEEDFSDPNHVYVYAERVINAIEEEKYKRVKVSANNISWESVANEWIVDLKRFAYNE